MTYKIYSIYINYKHRIKHPHMALLMKEGPAEHGVLREEASKGVFYVLKLQVLGPLSSIGIHWVFSWTSCLFSQT